MRTTCFHFIVNILFLLDLIILLSYHLKMQYLIVNTSFDLYFFFGTNSIVFESWIFSLKIIKNISNLFLILLKFYYVWIKQTNLIWSIHFPFEVLFFFPTPNIPVIRQQLSHVQNEPSSLGSDNSSLPAQEKHRHYTFTQSLSHTHTLSAIVNGDDIKELGFELERERERERENKGIYLICYQDVFFNSETLLSSSTSICFFFLFFVFVFFALLASLELCN